MTQSGGVKSEDGLGTTFAYFHNKYMYNADVRSLISHEAQQKSAPAVGEKIDKEEGVADGRERKERDATDVVNPGFLPHWCQTLFLGGPFWIYGYSKCMIT